MYAGFFFLVEHGLQFKHACEGIATAAMNTTNSCAYLSVVVSVDRFLNEINKTSLTLESGQQRDGFAANRHGN